MGSITISRGSYRKRKEMAEKPAQHLRQKYISRKFLFSSDSGGHSGAAALY
jgi:hypothetical protein